VTVWKRMAADDVTRRILREKHVRLATSAAAILRIALRVGRGQRYRLKAENGPGHC